ncbi:MAG: precorrin-8X methylmutase, partial [Waterburya sp.]
MSKLNHPIVEQSFAIIDREVGEYNLSSQEYAIARRVIHATADFEYLKLLRFS